MISRSPNPSSKQLSQRLSHWEKEANTEFTGCARWHQADGVRNVHPDVDAPLSILLIDDEPGIRLLLRHGLATQGHRIYEATDGVTGLAQFHALHPDLIFLDGNMPDMDGFAVLKELRRCDALVGIIMISAVSTKYWINSALHDGADRYLIKPVRLLQILDETQRVGAIVRQRRCPMYAAK